MVSYMSGMVKKTPSLNIAIKKPTKPKPTTPKKPSSKTGKKK